MPVIPNKFSRDYTAFGMLQFTHLNTITLSKLPYTLRKHFKDFKRCIGFSPLPRITTDVEMLCEYAGYLGKVLPNGWTPFKPGSSLIPKKGLKLATVATYGEKEYTLMEGRAYCNLAIKTDNLLLPTKSLELDSHETKVLTTYEVSYELLEYFNKVGVPWQIESGDRNYIRVDAKACGECCQYDIYPEAMRVLGFPYYSPNEYKANSEELHPFLEQLLYSEDEQGTKRLHETAQKHGLKIPEGTVTFKTYIEQILIPMGIEPIEFYRYHEYDPDSPAEESRQVLGVLPSRFRINNPELLLGFQGRIELTNLTKQQLQDDRSFINIPLDSITEIRSDGQSEVIAMTVRGEVLLRDNRCIYPPAFAVKEEFVSPYESHHRGEHHTILVPKDFNDIVPVAGFNFYSDMETFHTSDGTEVIRSRDLDKLKAQSAEIKGILQNPCMKKYEVKGNQIENTIGIYGNGGPNFSRDEFIRLFELNKSPEYLSREEIFKHPQGLFELFAPGKSSAGPLEIIGQPQVIHAWLNHLQEASLIGYEKILGQTFIRAKDVTYELMISDIVYIAERIPALYAVIRAMAATTPNLRELAAKALKACECTRV